MLKRGFVINLAIVAVALFLPWSGTAAETTSTIATSTVAVTTTPGLSPEDIINKVGEVAHTITTTAATVEQVYTETKAVIDQGKKVYEQGKTYYAKAQALWTRVQPWIDRAKPWWDKLSNHNDPKRLLIIFGIILVVYMSWRWNRRRQNYYDRF